MKVDFPLYTFNILAIVISSPCERPRKASNGIHEKHQKKKKRRREGKSIEMRNKTNNHHTTTRLSSAGSI